VAGGRDSRTRSPSCPPAFGAAGAAKALLKAQRQVAKREEGALAHCGGHLGALRPLPSAALTAGFGALRCRMELLKLLMEQHVAELKLELALHNRWGGGVGWGGVGRGRACAGRAAGRRVQRGRPARAGAAVRVQARGARAEAGAWPPPEPSSPDARPRGPRRERVSGEVAAAAAGDIPAVEQLAGHSAGELRRLVASLRKKCDDAQAHKRFLENQMAAALGGGGAAGGGEGGAAGAAAGGGAAGGGGAAAADQPGTSAAGAARQEQQPDAVGPGAGSSNQQQAEGAAAAAAEGAAAAAAGDAELTGGRQCGVCFESISEHMMLYQCGHYYCDS
jgi:hypothetical protein